ncbi:MAG: hypothetical protein R3E87_04560 [Burkholderiaceae bacterium]
MKSETSQATVADRELWLSLVLDVPWPIARLADVGRDRSAYSATARRWHLEDRDAHERLGFAAGCTAAARRLATLTASLR